MKRREFIAGSVGAAGLILGRDAVSAPCPPPTFGVLNGTNVATSCQNTAPAWFVAAPDREWVEIARHVEGKSIRAATSGMTAPTHPTDTDGIASLPNSFGGAVVDYERGELIVAQRGGHTQYCGNEAYGLRIASADPRWYRLIDPSPSATINDSDAIGTYSDGRMKSVHGWGGLAYGKNRVFHGALNSVFSRGGDGPRQTHAFNRAFSGVATAPGAAPLPWSNDRGPFEDYGTPPDTGNGWRKGPAVFDRNTGVFWVFNGGSAVVRTFNGNTLTHGQVFTEPSGSASLAPDTGWGVHAYDLGLIFCSLGVQPGPLYRGTDLLIFDPAQPTVWRRKTPANSFGNWMANSNSSVNYGAVYHKQARALYCCVRSNPSAIRVLDVPADPVGGAYAWRSVTLTGLIPQGVGGHATYGSFGIIEDMGLIAGVTRQALVLFTDVDGPTYALKLPAIGL